jgi:hypothetical protein
MILSNNPRNLAKPSLVVTRELYFQESLDPRDIHARRTLKPRRLSETSWVLDKGCGQGCDQGD